MQNDVEFIGALALYQHRRDAAIGLTHITTRQRHLIWYYNRLRKEMYKKAFSLGATIQIQKRMKEILREAETATPERVKQLHQEALQLEKIFDQWQTQYIK